MDRRGFLKTVAAATAVGAAPASALALVRAGTTPAALNESLGLFEVIWSDEPLQRTTEHTNPNGDVITFNMDSSVPNGVNDPEFGFQRFHIKGFARTCFGDLQMRGEIRHQWKRVKGIRDNWDFLTINRKVIFGSDYSTRLVPDYITGVQDRTSWFKMPDPGKTERAISDNTVRDFNGESYEQLIEETKERIVQLVPGALIILRGEQA